MLWSVQPGKPNLPQLRFLFSLKQISQSVLTDHEHGDGTFVYMMVKHLLK